MPTRKLWDHAIDIKKRFVPRKGKIYLLSREERRGMQVHIRTIKRVHQALKVTLNSTSILCRKKRWKEADSTEIFK